jgi:hypothetical protein
MKKKIAFVLSLFCASFMTDLNAQNEGVSINTTGAKADPSAILDIASDKKGLLVPRMTTSSRLKIQNPAASLLVFDTTSNSFWFYNGANWEELTAHSSGTTKSSTTFESANNLVSTGGGVDKINADFVFGSPGLGDNGNNHNSRFFFDKSKSAFRAGYTNDSEWDDANVGLYSIALGQNNIAAGESSVAIGKNNTIGGYDTYVLGEYNETTGNNVSILGLHNEANANNSYIVGLYNTTGDNYSYILGELNETKNGSGAIVGSNNVIHDGDESVVVGRSNHIYGDRATTLGFNNINRGDYATILGRWNEAKSYGETVLGLFATVEPGSATNFVSTDRLFAIGNGTHPYSNRSNALSVFKDGRVNINDAYNLPTADGTTGQVMSTDGSGNVVWANNFNINNAYNLPTADGIAGQVMSTDGSGNVVWTNRNIFGVGGQSTNAVATGWNAAAWGTNTTASYYLATAFGRDVTASGGQSTGWGEKTTASGLVSTAWGTNTIASGYNATAWGFQTEAPSFVETTMGQYTTTYTPNSTSSWNTSDRLLCVGNGTSTSDRSNALTIYKDGRVNINDVYNLPTADGTSGQVMSTDGNGNVTWANNNRFGVGGQTSNATATAWSAAAWGHNTAASANSATAFGKLSTASGQQATAFGYQVIASGNQATAFGQESIASGTNATAFGKYTTASGENATTWGLQTKAPSYMETAMGQFTTTYTPNSTNSWNTSDRLLCVGNGIDNLNRSNAFTIYKDGNATLSGNLTQNSDRRLKTNIQALSSTLPNIMQLGGYTYNWKDTTVRSKDLQIGLIAQEVQAVYPELVQTNEEGMLSVNYNGLVPVLLEAIKEQQAQIEELKSYKASTQQQEEEMASRMNAIELLLKQNGISNTTTTAQK